jgi:uncharacterized protein YprB with RNaseH-like and TPR domain
MTNLRARLTELRGPPPVPVATSPGAPEWLERLERLRLLARERLGNGARRQAPLPGVEIAPGLLRVQSRVSGLKIRFAGLDLPEKLRPPWHCGPGVERSQLLLFDTETSGLCGGVGLKVFMLGLLHWDEDAWVMTQYLLTRLEGEGALVAEWMRVCALRSCLVSYNGKRFDIPAMRTLQTLHGTGELSAFEHWDLLYPIRRAFRKDWPDCRLATAERNLLKRVRGNDLPGSEAPRAWREYLADGSTENLLRVLAHNRTDLESLLGILRVLLHEPRAAAPTLLKARARARVRPPSHSLSLALECR